MFVQISPVSVTESTKDSAIESEAAYSGKNVELYCYRSIPMSYCNRRYFVAPQNRFALHFSKKLSASTWADMISRSNCARYDSSSFGLQSEGIIIGSNIT